MNLFNELGKDLLGEIAPTGRCLYYTGGGGYFQGVRSFYDFSSESVTLLFKGGELLIRGKNLVVAKFKDGDCRLNGNIYSLQYRSRIVGERTL